MLVPATALLLALAATLPTPPVRVRFKARPGDVTLDHQAHLARRTACKSCHGPGQVGKLERFELQQAHLLCVGCHRDGKRGPIVCKDCHKRDAPPDPGATWHVKYVPQEGQDGSAAQEAAPAPAQPAAPDAQTAATTPAPDPGPAPAPTPPGR